MKNLQAQSNLARRGTDRESRGSSRELFRRLALGVSGSREARLLLSELRRFEERAMANRQQPLRHE